MSDNWVVQNLQNALTTWNEKLAEIWVLLTEEPEHFRMENTTLRMTSVELCSSISERNRQ